MLVKAKYNFTDIHIFGKTLEGYISLSDFELLFNCSVVFNSEEKYLLGLPTISGYCIAPVTLQDIMALAGVNPNTPFIRQLCCGIDKLTAEELVALYCSKKIINSKSGKIELEENDEDDLIYRFVRVKRNKQGRFEETLITKKFTIKEGVR